MAAPFHYRGATLFLQGPAIVGPSFFGSHTKCQPHSASCGLAASSHFFTLSRQHPGARPRYSASYASSCCSSPAPSWPYWRWAPGRRCPPNSPTWRRCSIECKHHVRFFAHPVPRCEHTSRAAARAAPATARVPARQASSPPKYGCCFPYARPVRRSSAHG